MPNNTNKTLLALDSAFTLTGSSNTRFSLRWHGIYLGQWGTEEGAVTFAMGYVAQGFPVAVAV